MADNDNKNNGIKIDISYKYDSSGLKRAVADIEKVDTQTERGIIQTKKNIDALVSASKSMVQYLTKDNEKVAKSIEKQTEAYRTLLKAQNAYDSTVSKVSEATKKFDVAKHSALFTRTGRARKNIEVSGTNVYRIKKNRDGKETSRTLDEKLTTKLVSANEALKRARLSQNSALITLQSNENKYKQALLETAAVQKQVALDKIRGRVDAVSNAVNKLKNKIKQIDLTKVIAQIFMLRRAWQVALKFIEASAEWVENLNLLEVVFGESADAAKDFVKATSNNLGLDANELAQYVSTFKQMANAMGQAAETGNKLATALTYLGLDISSLRNVDIKTAMSDLASGIAGQVKPVRKYGADITEDSINAFLRAYGMSASALSQSDKQLLRALLLIRQLKDSWGDMAKTINTFSNQQRVLNSQFETFKRLIGSILVGTFELTDKNGLPTTFEEASKTAGIATKAIWYLNGALIAINEVLGAIVPKTNNVNGAIGTVSDEISDLTEQTNESAEAAKGSLASFDKFTTLGSGKSSGDATSSFIKDLFDKESTKYIEAVENSIKKSSMYAKDIANTLLGKIFPEFKAWKDKNKDGVFADWAKETGDLQGKFEKLKTDISGLFTLVVAIKSPIAAIGLAIGKMALTDSTWLQRIVDLFVELSQSLTDLLPKIAELAMSLAPVAMQILEVAVNVLDWLNKNDLLLPTIGLVISAILSFKALQFGLHIAEIAEKSVKFATALGKLKNMITKVLIPFTKFTQTNAGLLTAIVSIGLGVAIFVKNLDKLGSTAKIIIPTVAALAAAIIGVAVAMSAASAGPLAALKAGLTAAAITSGVTLAAGTIISLAAEKHADGGFQTGGLFYAGEKGAEWVGRQGSTSTIVNDTQMSDIMQFSVEKGVVNGLTRMQRATGSTANNEAAIYLDGDKVGRFVAANYGFRQEANRRNPEIGWV